MSTAQVERLVKSSFEKIKTRFDKANKEYHINTRPYYSSGAVPFKLSLLESVGGVNRYIAVAEAGTEIVLFSYGDGDNVKQVGLGDRPADNHDTNQSTANRTNSEDVAIEGFSVHSRGVRMAGKTAVGSSLPPAIRPYLPLLGISEGNAAAQSASIPCEDPSASLFTPETHSPLTLEDLIWRAIAPKMTFETQWNRKAVDLLGCLDQVPEGGANSFLKANGDPTCKNYFEIPEGLYWKQEGSPADSLFSLLCKLNQDVIVLCSSNAVPYVDSSVVLTDMWAEFKVKAHARSFYYPSSNN